MNTLKHLLSRERILAHPARTLLPEGNKVSLLEPQVVMNPWRRTHPPIQACPERIEHDHLATSLVILTLRQRRGEQTCLIQMPPTWNESGASMPALAVKRHSFQVPGLDEPRICVLLLEVSKALVPRERTPQARHIPRRAGIAVPVPI